MCNCSNQVSLMIFDVRWFCPLICIQSSVKHILAFSCWESCRLVYLSIEACQCQWSMSMSMKKKARSQKLNLMLAEVSQVNQHLKILKAHAGSWSQAHFPAAASPVFLTHSRWDCFVLGAKHASVAARAPWITMNHYESLWITMNHYEHRPGMARPWPGFMHPTPAEPQIEQATRLYETLRDYSNLPIVSYSTIFLAARKSFLEMLKLGPLSQEPSLLSSFSPWSNDPETWHQRANQSCRFMSFEVMSLPVWPYTCIVRFFVRDGRMVQRPVESITCLSFWNIMGHVSRTFDIWYWTKYTASAREAHPSHRPCRSWNPCLCAKVILKYPI